MKISLQNGIVLDVNKLNETGIAKTHDEILAEVSDRCYHIQTPGILLDEKFKPVAHFNIFGAIIARFEV